jgi:ubiquinone/menaquinone biosynthesis C-methylase UbiE
MTTAPPPHETPRAIGLWNSVARVYDLVFIPLDLLLFRRWRRRAVASIERWPLLEVGAGTGLNFPLYPRQAYGVATDVSYAMLRRAARRKDRPPRMHLVVADVHRLPFRDGAFAEALATLVFCGVASPGLGLAELRRAVGPSGRAVLFEHVRPKGALGRCFDFLNLFTAPLFCEHLNRETAAEVAKRFEIAWLRETGRGVLQLISARSGKI